MAKDNDGALAIICERLRIVLASEIAGMASGDIVFRVFVCEHKINGHNEDSEKSTMQIPSLSAITIKDTCSALRASVSRELETLHSGVVGIRVVIRNGKIARYHSLLNRKFKH